MQQQPYHTPLRRLGRFMVLASLWAGLAWGEDAAAPEGGGASAEPAVASSSAPAAPLPALKVQREEDQQKWLTQQLGKDKVVALNAEGGPFIALWQPDTSGKPLGAVVLLHDEGQNLNWVNSLHNLREYLSRHGWATLSIALPDPSPLAPPARPVAPVTPPAASASAVSASAGVEAASASAAPPVVPPESQVVYNDAQNTLAEGAAASSAPPQPQPRLSAPPAEPIVMARIQAALDFLASHNQHNNMLLGEGLGATRGTRFILSQPTSGLRALIWINPRPSLRAEPPFQLISIFDAPPMPILDIAYPQDAEPAWALGRVKAARKAGFKDYKQHLLVDNAPPLTGESRITRLVRGYLNRYLAGKEIKTPLE